MVDIKDVLSFSYYTYKQPFTGSDKGKRYRIVRLEKEIKGEDGTESTKELAFQVALWKDYLSYENTPKEEMQIEEYRTIRKSPDGDEWKLLDFGSIVVHLMSSTARKFYDLERLWYDSPNLLV